MSTYLVHHGYSATAEVFAQTTGQPISEDLASIKNRQSRWKRSFFRKFLGRKMFTLRKLSYNLLLFSCDSCSRFDQDMRDEKE